MNFFLEGDSCDSLQFIQSPGLALVCVNCTSLHSAVKFDLNSRKVGTSKFGYVSEEPDNIRYCVELFFLPQGLYEVNVDLYPSNTSITERFPEQRQFVGSVKIPDVRSIELCGKRVRFDEGYWNLTASGTPEWTSLCNVSGAVEVDQKLKILFASSSPRWIQFVGDSTTREHFWTLCGRLDMPLTWRATGRHLTYADFAWCIDSGTGSVITYQWMLSLNDNQKFAEYLDKEVANTTFADFLDLSQSNWTATTPAPSSKPFATVVNTGFHGRPALESRETLAEIFALFLNAFAANPRQTRKVVFTLLFSCDVARLEPQYVQHAKLRNAAETFYRNSMIVRGLRSTSFAVVADLFTPELHFNHISHRDAIHLHGAGDIQGYIQQALLTQIVRCLL